MKGKYVPKRDAHGQIIVDPTYYLKHSQIDIDYLEYKKFKELDDPKTKDPKKLMLTTGSGSIRVQSEKEILEKLRVDTYSSEEEVELT